MGKDWKEFIVKDGIESKRYDYIWNIKYSPNWKNFAFIAKKDWKNIIVKDFTEINKYENISETLFQYSPDWKEFTFVAEEKWKRFLVKEVCSENNSIQNNLTKAKNSLKNTKFEKYVKIIDKVFLKFSNEKILKLSKKLEKLDFNSKKVKKYKDLLVYIKAKIEVEILEREIK